MSRSQRIFASVAVVSLAAGAASAQTLSDARSVSPGQAVAQSTFAAETACRDTFKDTTQNTESCIEAVEQAIRDLGAYQLYMSENRGSIYMNENFGEVGNEISVRPDDVNRMGRMALADDVYDQASQLDLKLENGLEGAILDADRTLKGIFVYARADSLGTHPEAQNIGNVIVGLATQLQAEQAAAPIEPN